MSTGAGAAPSDILEDLQPAPARHGDVEQHQVETAAQGLFQCLLAVRGLTVHDHAALAGEDLLHSLAHNGVVVCHQDPNHG